MKKYDKVNGVFNKFINIEIELFRAQKLSKQNDCSICPVLTIFSYNS